MINFSKIKFKNFLSYGNAFTEIELNVANKTLLCGRNGFGKCVDINTPIRIQNTNSGEILELTIGELYEQTEQNNIREN